MSELTAELDLIAVKIELQQLGGLIEEIEKVEQRLKSGAFGVNAEDPAEQVRLHCAVLKAQVHYSEEDFDGRRVCSSSPTMT